MEQWIRRRFEVVADGWHGDGAVSDAFVVSAHPELITASITMFVSNFGETAPVSATHLKATDPDDAKGWHRHFNDWVERGILPT